MKAEKYLVTIQCEDDERQELWDSSKPLTSGYPFHWVLEQTETGVRLRDLSGESTTFSSGHTVNLVDSQLGKGTKVQIPKSPDSFLRIKKVEVAKSLFEERPAEPVGGLLYAYSCIDEWVVDATEVGRNYIGRTPLQKVFNLSKTGGGYSLSPVVEGVYIVRTGANSRVDKQVLTKGMRQQFETGEIAKIEIFYDHHCWRFTIADARVQLKPVSADESILVEDRRFKFVAISSMLLFLLLMGLIIAFIPKNGQIVRKLEDESINLNVLRPPEPKKPEEIKKKPLPPKPKPKPKPKPVVVKPPAPKPVVRKPTPVVKKQAPVVKPRVIQKPVAPPKPVESEAMKSLKALKAFNLTSQISKTGISRNTAASAPSVNAQSLFKGSNRNLAPTNVQGASVEDIQTATIGSKGVDGAIGYASKVDARVANQGAQLTKVSTEAIQVEEGLEKHEISAVVASHQHEMTNCFNIALMSNPNQAGQMLVSFAIAGSGKVKSVDVVKSDFNDPKFSNCVTSRIKNWIFPPPKGGVTVKSSYPFVFRKL